MKLFTGGVFGLTDYDSEVRFPKSIIQNGKSNMRNKKIEKFLYLFNRCTILNFKKLATLKTYKMVISRSFKRILMFYILKKPHICCTLEGLIKTSQKIVKFEKKIVGEIVRIKKVYYNWEYWRRNSLNWKKTVGKNFQNYE